VVLVVVEVVVVDEVVGFPIVNLQVLLSVRMNSIDNRSFLKYLTTKTATFSSAI
jgi:hypothetical protein